MNILIETSDFVRRVRTRMRFGELSRAPLQLLRLELTQNSAECDWLVRPADDWDADLPPHVRETNRSLQALRDAVQMREMLFSTFRDLPSATFRVFRPSALSEPELIMTGTAQREDEIPIRIPSVVMRAKLSGFRFSLSDGVLVAMTS